MHREPSRPRLVTMSRTGRYVALRRRGGIDVVDALGTSPRILLEGEPLDFACVGTAVWVLRDRCVDQIALATGKTMASVRLPAPQTRLIAGDDAALAGDVLVVGTSLEPAVARAAAPLGGRSIAVVTDGNVQIVEPGKPAIDALRTADEVLAIHALFGGRLIAVLTRGAEDTWHVVRRDGARVHKIATPIASHRAVAVDAGAVIATIDGAWTRIDLRYGHTRTHGPVEHAVRELGVSADGRHVVMAYGDAAEPGIVHVPETSLLAAPVAPAVVAEAIVDAAPPVADEPDPRVPAPATPAPAPAIEMPLPLALGTPLAPLEIAAAPDGWTAYPSAHAHLDDMLQLVAARVASAIARSWHTGRIGAMVDRQPHYREVRALLGDGTGFAPEELAEAEARAAAVATRVAGRTRATVAAGIRLPFIELMRELDLSPTAGQIVITAFAPAERGEIARLLGILANDPSRPAVDRYLLELVLFGIDRGAIGAELAASAPLRRFGVVHVSERAISIDPVVAARLCGRVARTPREVRAFDELAIDQAAARELAELLARPRRADDPLRLVLRGRPGSGRRSVIAALAARVGRTIGEVDCTQLSRGAALPGELERELRHAALLGAIPVVSGLEALTDLHDQLRHVVRAHPGPLVIRATLDASVPVDRGVPSISLRPLSSTERARFWQAAIARAQLDPTGVDDLAARWRIGPGIVERVIADVANRAPSEGATAAALDDTARRHIATRLDHVATPVRRLARWEDVALPDDIVDSIRELIGRIARHRTVFEDWGFDAKMASSRGVTALLYGPPGTGKSMVAGLIARELGLELYRVDLSRVVSKWIGETEKQLGEVFDAAEDGQAVILFDEADSLFAKRTEVKTSVDRYANLEVNYLLQRLDSFEGIAILTTNLDGSIDPAFKRRMSMRLQFPFPDAEIRERLWAAHIPTGAPTAGDFDFAALARKFTLSGGYIRNSALRAAFLAAQERRPIGQDHLLRAIALEYRELGKLSADGRME